MDPRYLVVFGACLTQFTIIGLLFSYGLFFTIFEAEFGWSRAFVSSCSSLAFLMMGVLAIFVGRLSDRYGPRAVLCVTGPLFALGYGLISQVAEPWQLVAIFGLLISLGLASHDVVTLSTVARLFQKRRGAMSGVVKVGTAIGQVAVPPAAAVLIVELGWRSATVALGALAAVVLLFAAMAMRTPRAPQAAAGATEGAARSDGFSFAEARGSRVFWTLCAMQFLFFPTLTAVPLHIVVHGSDLGLTAPVAAVLLSILGGASIAGRLAIGAFADRIGGRRAYALCLAPLIAALLALLVVDSPQPLFAVVALYGFGHGGLFAVVSPTIAEYFGLRAHGAVFGAVVFFGAVGGAVGPIAAGRIFDQVGSYDLAFTSLAGLATLALVLAFSLPSTRGEALSPAGSA